MDKQIYDVARGVAWVNGKPVPESRRVELTEAEAQYDLGLGRISLASTGTGNRGRAAPPAAED